MIHQHTQMILSGFLKSLMCVYAWPLQAHLPQLDLDADGEDMMADQLRQLRGSLTDLQLRYDQAKRELQEAQLSEQRCGAVLLNSPMSCRRHFYASSAILQASKSGVKTLRNAAKQAYHSNTHHRLEPKLHSRGVTHGEGLQVYALARDARDGPWNGLQSVMGVWLPA